MRPDCEQLVLALLVGLCLARSVSGGDIFYNISISASDQTSREKNIIIFPRAFPLSVTKDFPIVVDPFKGSFSPVESAYMYLDCSLRINTPSDQIELSLISKGSRAEENKLIRKVYARYSREVHMTTAVNMQRIVGYQLLAVLSKPQDVTGQFRIVKVSPLIGHSLSYHVFEEQVGVYKSQTQTGSGEGFSLRTTSPVKKEMVVNNDGVYLFHYLLSFKEKGYANISMYFSSPSNDSERRHYVIDNKEYSMQTATDFDLLYLSRGSLLALDSYVTPGVTLLEGSVLIMTKVANSMMTVDTHTNRTNWFPHWDKDLEVSCTNYSLEFETTGNYIITSRTKSEVYSSKEPAGGRLSADGSVMSIDSTTILNPERNSAVFTLATKQHTVPVRGGLPSLLKIAALMQVANEFEVSSQYNMASTNNTTIYTVQVPLYERLLGSRAGLYLVEFNSMVRGNCSQAYLCMLSNAQSTFNPEVCALLYLHPIGTETYISYQGILPSKKLSRPTLFLTCSGPMRSRALVKQMFTATFIGTMPSAEGFHVFLGRSVPVKDDITVVVKWRPPQLDDPISFVRTEGWSAEDGMYTAPYNGTYLINCRIKFINVTTSVSKESLHISLHIFIKHGNLLMFKDTKTLPSNMQNQTSFTLVVLTMLFLSAKDTVRPVIITVKGVDATIDRSSSFIIYYMSISKTGYTKTTCGFLARKNGNEQLMPESSKVRLSGLAFRGHTSSSSSFLVGHFYLGSCMRLSLQNGTFKILEDGVYMLMSSYHISKYETSLSSYVDVDGEKLVGSTTERSNMSQTHTSMVITKLRTGQVISFFVDSGGKSLQLKSGASVSIMKITENLKRPNYLFTKPQGFLNEWDGEINIFWETVETEDQQDPIDGDGSVIVKQSGLYLIVLSLSVDINVADAVSVITMKMMLDNISLAYFSLTSSRTMIYFTLLKRIEAFQQLKLRVSGLMDGDRVTLGYGHESMFLLTLVSTFSQPLPREAPNSRDKRTASERGGKEGIYFLSLDTTICHTVVVTKLNQTVEIPCRDNMLFLLAAEEGYRLTVPSGDLMQFSGSRPPQNYVSSLRDAAAVQAMHVEQTLVCSEPLWTLMTGWSVDKDGRDGSFILGDIVTIRDGLFLIKQAGLYVGIIQVMTAYVVGLREFHVVKDSKVYDASKVVARSQSFVQSGTSVQMDVTFVMGLAYYQTLAVFVSCPDGVAVQLPTRFSLLLLDDRENILQGPNIIVHPTPISVEAGTGIVNWTCEAVAPGEVHYQWMRNFQVVVEYGNFLSINTSDNNIGTYLCVAESGGSRSLSRRVEIRIPDSSTCSVGGRPCSPMASCVPVDDNFRCMCIAGYSGDGITCSDVDECSFVNNTICPPKSTCRNTIGSFECLCPNGYKMGLYGCEDIDECINLQSKYCHEQATCVNTPGSFACRCLTGFFGDGQVCYDTNECLREDSCHEHANCTNSVGSYSCSCRNGWTGNGTHCQDINECLTYEGCHINATCKNLPGSFVCECNRGFRGDGVKTCIALGCTPPAYCTGLLIAGWWSRPPYVDIDKESRATGLFVDVVSNLVKECCQRCSQIEFTYSLNSSMQLEKLITMNVSDISFPMYGTKEQKFFQDFPYMSIVESPGVAFFVSDVTPHSNPLVRSVASAWPVLVITLLLAMISGVIIWFLDTLYNPKDFPQAFIQGSWEGFWWAFISMTTVGYGDKAPKSFCARVFGVIWILTGLVIVSTFTATITTNLTASSLSNEVKLYGTKVGALTNSEEYRLGVRRNAIVHAYDSVQEITQALREKTIEGALIDTYIAAEYVQQLSEYRVQQIFDYSFTYGIVLSRYGLSLKNCFHTYLETRQSEIYRTISAAVKPLRETRNQSVAEMKSSNIFDADSPAFQMVVIGSFVFLIVLVISGLVWDYLYWRVKRLTKKSSYSKSLSSAEANNLLRQQLSELRSQVQNFSDLWMKRLDDIENRHDHFQNDAKNGQHMGGTRRPLLSGSREEENRV